MQEPRRRRPVARPGFSLPELLVVIAIIGTLTAFLIPVISNAVAAGRTVRCASNLKQIGLQLMAYATDHRGVTIVAYDAAEDATWQKLLAVYDGTYAHLTSSTRVGKGVDYGIWRCPENREQERILSGAVAGEKDCSYGINGWATSAQEQGTRYTGASVAIMTHPSQLYMVTEACYFRVEEHKTNGDKTLPAGLYQKGPSYLRYPHRGKINMVFADGHLELLEGPLLGRGNQIAAGESLANRFSNGVHWYSH